MAVGIKEISEKLQVSCSTVSRAFNNKHLLNPQTVARVLAAAVVIDAVVRLLPGVLGAKTATVEESFSDGKIEYPQYTRPEVFEDLNEIVAVNASENIFVFKVNCNVFLLGRFLHVIENSTYN